MTTTKTTISTPQYLVDQAKRRFTPTVNTLPGMGALEKRLLGVDWKEKTLANPPPGSDLKPIVGDSGLPILGHIVEMFRGGPDYPLFLYNTRGPVTFADSPILPSIVALGPTPPRRSSPTAKRTTRRRAGSRSSARSSTAA